MSDCENLMFRKAELMKKNHPSTATQNSRFQAPENVHIVSFLCSGFNVTCVLLQSTF